MCGIAGIWRYGKSLHDTDRQDIGRMTAALTHRGPDGEGIRIDGTYAFGHRRLAILDPTDHAAQPMATPDGAGDMIYNGEVYNYRELRAELERDGVAFRSTGDAEVVLMALHRWGPEAAIPRFNGMFALAYFDRRAEALWIARDRLGIKPLSLAVADGRLLFASEDKALLAASGVRAEIDPGLLALRFAGLKDANTVSLFRGLTRLQPGTMLRLGGGGETREITWWDPLSALDVDRIASDRRPDSEKAETLHGLVEQSVRMHLAADRPVASCLSGGVDSGLITAIAAQSLPGMSAYVADPDEGPNETKEAAASARRIAAALHPVKFDRQAFLRRWPDVVFAMETPSPFASDAALLAIAERCRDDGIPVLLTGEGADELFGGYGHYIAAARRWSLADAPFSWFRKKASRDRLLARLEEAPSGSSIVRVDTRARPPGIESAAPLATWRQTAFARAVSALPSHRDRGVIASGLYDLTGHLQTLLNRHDRLAMAASVEMRVPFIENALIDFGMHLPGRDRLRFRTSKYLLKKVARRHVPRANIDRRKRGFPLTFSYSAGCEALLRDGLLKEAFGWTRPDLDAAMAHASETPAARQLLVGAELLARIFVGGETVEDLGERLVALARA